MARKLTGLSRRYQAALRRHIQQGTRASSASARRLGRQAMLTGLEALDLARIHEQALIRLAASAPSISRDRMIKRAGKFFAEVIAPMEKTHRIARDANARLTRMIETLHRRSAALADSNQQLQQEITRRKQVEESLRNSERHYGELLKRSHHLQDQLRHLSRQLLLAQEEERKRISRELHDEIAQTLTSINVRLAELKSEASVNAKGLQKKIARTQKMVEKSVDIVHRFARELRPTVLDDLGLIPALHSFVKTFSKQTRAHVHITAYAAVERLDNVRRTVIYRVAQEALTNVARHACASRVEVSIQKLPQTVQVIIKDNGKSFEVERVLRAKAHKRLGLLGMRERVEMVGGKLHVESTPGHGTTIRAEIPLNNGRRV